MHVIINNSNKLLLRILFAFHRSGRGIFDELKMKKKSIGYLNDNLMKEMSAKIVKVKILFIYFFS